MPPTPRPIKPSAPVERAATCLETDEDVLYALRANFGTPPSAAHVPPAVPVASPPPPRQAAAPQAAAPQAAAPQAAARPAGPQPWSVTPYRPTLRPPMAVLTVFDDGKSEGEQIRLRGSRFVIGRTEGDLVLPHDAMISARHVEITRQAVGSEQRWVITDLQSTNGLFVRVSRTALADQAELLAGKGRYRLLAPTTEGAPTADYAPPEAVRNSTQAWGNEAGAPAIASLVEIIGNATSNRVLLVGAEYWIGTDPGCAICRVNDPFCEARHARLFRDAKGGWHVEQNKAVNGLWFRVPQVVAEGAVHFQVGEQRLRLKVGG